MDPHKRSATIEIIDGREQVLAQGRYGTDSDGYRAMLAVGRRYPQRVWAVEGCNGIGRHVAQRLVAGGAKKHLSAPQARTILATVRPRNVVGRTRRQLASDLITELAVIDKKIKQANAALTALIATTGSRLRRLNGIGPSVAA